MSAVVSPEGADPAMRAREMAALAEPDRDMRIALGILWGVVIDGRERFRRPVVFREEDYWDEFTGDWGA